MKKIYEENFDVGEIGQEIKWEADEGTIFLDEEFFVSPEKSLRISTPTEGGGAIGYGWMPIPENRYLKWVTKIRLNVGELHINAVEFEINIEESSQNKGTNIHIAYIPYNGDWTKWNGSEWPVIGNHPLSVGDFHTVELTVDLGDTGKSLFLVVDGVPVATIEGVYHTPGDFYNDLMTVGYLFLTEDPTAQFINVDNVEVYEVGEAVSPRLALAILAIIEACYLHQKKVK